MVYDDNGRPLQPCVAYANRECTFSDTFIKHVRYFSQLRMHLHKGNRFDNVK